MTATLAPPSPPAAPPVLSDPLPEQREPEERRAWRHGERWGALKYCPNCNPPTEGNPWPGGCSLCDTEDGGCPQDRANAEEVTA